MKTSVLVAAHDVQTVDRPAPVPRDDEVLVRVSAVGVCGSDVHYYAEGRIGDAVVESPLVLGHEAAGTIVAVGAGVDGTRVGERVSLEPQRTCRVCEQCTSGRYNLCPSVEFFATPPVDGAFSELVCVPAERAHPVPDSVSDEAAALCEPLSVAIWAHRRAGTTVGSRVLVTGAGPVGLLCVQTALIFGASEVIVSDPVPERRAAAAARGATTLLDPTVDDVGGGGLDVDVFIEASGALPAVRAGIMELAPAGRAVLVGIGAQDMPLPVGRIQNRELEVTGVFRYAGTWPAAIELVASGRVDLDSLVTGRFTLDEVDAALRSVSDPATVKSVVLP